MTDPNWRARHHERCCRETSGIHSVRISTLVDISTRRLHGIRGGTGDLFCFDEHRFVRIQLRAVGTIHTLFCWRTVCDVHNIRNASLRNEHEPRTDPWFSISCRLLACAVDLFCCADVCMLVAAEVFLQARGGVGPYCAKLHHPNNKRCIFTTEVEQLRPVILGSRR